MKVQEVKYQTRSRGWARSDDQSTIQLCSDFWILPSVLTQKAHLVVQGRLETQRCGRHDEFLRDGHVRLRTRLVRRISQFPDDHCDEAPGAECDHLWQSSQEDTDWPRGAIVDSSYEVHTHWIIFCRIGNDMSWKPHIDEKEKGWSYTCS